MGSLKKYYFGKNKFDKDAWAFIVAAGLIDMVQKKAVNNLVISLKNYGIWSKMKAIYPFVGGTASNHKYNLKDPRDLDAAFRMVFGTGATHSSTGVITATSGTVSLNTKLVPSAVFSQNEISINAYVRSGTSVNRLWSCIDVVARTIQAFANINISGAKFLSDCFNADGGTARITASNTNSIGFFQMSRTFSPTKHAIYYRGSLVGSNATTGGNRPTVDFQFSEVGNANEFSFASIGDPLTDTECANFYTSVQAFQTSLGRQI